MGTSTGEGQKTFHYHRDLGCFHYSCSCFKCERGKKLNHKTMLTAKPVIVFVAIERERS